MLQLFATCTVALLLRCAIMMCYDSCLIRQGITVGLEELFDDTFAYCVYMYSGIPETPGQLVQFVVAVQNFYVQQRSLTKPIIVQCRYLSSHIMHRTF